MRIVQNDHLSRFLSTSLCIPSLTFPLTLLITTTSTDHNRLFILSITYTDFQIFSNYSVCFFLLLLIACTFFCARLLLFALSLTFARVLVVSFKRPDKIATSAPIKPFREEPVKTCRKRKKPGESKYLHGFCFFLSMLLFLLC